MTHLTGAGEEQYGFTVLVLDAVDRLTVHARNVLFHLPGRMGVQCLTHLVDHALDLGLVLGCQRRFNRIEMLRLEHATLREGELEHGVVDGIVPVDQLVDDVVVNPKRQHGCNHFHLMLELGGKSLQLLNLLQVTGGVNLEGRCFGDGNLDGINGRM